MTQDELARVPEGGYTWKWSNCGFWAEVYEGKGLVCRVSERNARQIVGGVNAAILVREYNEFLHSEGFNFDKNESETQFWLDYTKGNA